MTSTFRNLGKYYWNYLAEYINYYAFWQYQSQHNKLKKWKQNLKKTKPHRVFKQGEYSFAISTDVSFCENKKIKQKGIEISLMSISKTSVKNLKKSYPKNSNCYTQLASIVK